MENTNDEVVLYGDEDTITIHLGGVLSQDQYDIVVKSVIDFLNANWSHLLKIQS